MKRNSCIKVWTIIKDWVSECFSWTSWVPEEWTPC